MEKILTPEERIRRAEEIYQRRRGAINGGIRVSSSSVNHKKNKLTLFRKMAMQLAICAVIYIIFYLIKNTNYIFSEDVIQKTKELLSYDINFQNLYNHISTFLQTNNEPNQMDNELLNEITGEMTNEMNNEITNEITNEMNSETTNEMQNETVNDIQTNQVAENMANAIGGIRRSKNK